MRKREPKYVYITTITHTARTNKNSLAKPSVQQQASARAQSTIDQAGMLRRHTSATLQYVVSAQYHQREAPVVSPVVVAVRVPYLLELKLKVVRTIVLGSFSPNLSAIPSLRTDVQSANV